MYEFEAHTAFRVTGRGWVFVAKPLQSPTIVSKMVNSVIRIDDEEYLCSGYGTCLGGGMNPLGLIDLCVRGELKGDHVKFAKAP